MCVAMDFCNYSALRPFGYFTTLEIGFTAFISNLISGIRERDVLRLANRIRLCESQAAIRGYCLARCGVAALWLARMCWLGREMCSAVAAMSAAVAECTALGDRVSRPALTPCPPVCVRRPRLASEAAYLALTLCVFPKHCGYLESYEMDQGVRLVKAGLLVDEYEAFESRVDRWYGDIIPVPVMTLTDNLRCSILTRLRRLSLSFVPVGSRYKQFFAILCRVRSLCREGGSCYRVALLDPLRPRAIELLPPV